MLLSFPISLVAVALTLLSLAALSRNAWLVGGPAIALCAVTAVPGVVRQEDLDARWVNALPAVGVALALGLTVAAALRASISVAPALPADRLRIALGVAIGILSLPWLSAELGFHLPGDVFLGEEVPAGETLAAVHLGHHHGLDGALLVASALLLSRRRPAGRSGAVYVAYVSLAFGYGAVNFAQDLWQEQLVKRGWVDWSIPTALEPGLRPVWLAILALVRSGLVVAHARARDTTTVSAPGMVFLGFGKYVRADRIYALEPITGDNRGNGRRTLVWVEGIAEPVVASRTQETILEDMAREAEVPRGKRSRRPVTLHPQLFIEDE